MVSDAAAAALSGDMTPVASLAVAEAAVASPAAVSGSGFGQHLLLQPVLGLLGQLRALLSSNSSCISGARPVLLISVFAVQGLSLSPCG